MPVVQATIWVYGQTCYGHLKLHFLDNDELWMIFSDAPAGRRWPNLVTLGRALC